MIFSKGTRVRHSQLVDGLVLSGVVRIDDSPNYPDERGVIWDGHGDLGTRWYHIDHLCSLFDPNDVLKSML